MVKDILELVERLPHHLQAEVRDFAEFLLQRHLQSDSRKMKLDWAGGLHDLRDRFTSVDLQHVATEWWAQGERHEVSRGH